MTLIISFTNPDTFTCFHIYSNCLFLSVLKKECGIVAPTFPSCISCDLMRQSSMLLPYAHTDIHDLKVVPQ